MNMAESCNICRNDFANHYNLVRHINSIHVKEFEYECPTCNEIFLRSDTLSDHLRLHTNETVICNICNVVFTTKSSLNRHLKNTNIHDFD